MHRGSRALAALAGCALAAACTRAARPAAPATPLPAQLEAALAWVPSDVTWITHQGPGQIALLSVARSSLPDARRPACFDRLAAQVDHVFMLSRFLGDPSVNAAHGLTDRVATEDCAVEVLAALTGERASLERDGRITRASSRSGAMILGWSDDGWLYFHRDRGRVEALLARGAAPTLAPSLRPLLARVSLADGLWSVFAGDATGAFIRVPSTGLIQRLDAGRLAAGERALPAPSGVPVTFLFASEDEARRAAAALAAAGGDPDLPPPLRDALRAMRPGVRDAEVDVDVAQLFTDTGAIEAAAAILKARTGAR